MRFLSSEILNGENMKFEKNQVSVYDVTIQGTRLDIYDILAGYKVSNPAIQHAVKKILVAGKRGVKSETQDLKEAIGSLYRALEIIDEESRNV